MKRCENCNHGDWVRNNEYRANKVVCNLCKYVDENGKRVPSNWKAIVHTNADRIRAMSDEELATDLLDMFEQICEDGVPSKEWMLEWLKWPVEEGEDNG